MAAVLVPGFSLTLLKGDFGAQVAGVDIGAPLDAATRASLREAFGRHRLLVFRDQNLPPAAHIAFSRIFGELEIHVLDEYHKAEYPEIFELSNIGPDGRPNAVHPDRGTLFWHTDASWQAMPALATLLYAEAVPRQGGHTLFADMIGAYEALGTAERERFAQLRVVHDLDISRRKAGYPGMTPAQKAKRPPIEQPLVRMHTPTGRRAMYLGSHGQQIVGMGEVEGRGLIERIMAHCAEPRFVVEHVWQPGDLVMWDNGATMHRATEYDTATEPRVVRRTVVQGAAAIPG
ncbi:MAG: TauD/TfdA dioxygenase family protein [Burkholderiales bacterium]